LNIALLVLKDIGAQQDRHAPMFEQKGDGRTVGNGTVDGTGSLGQRPNIEFDPITILRHGHRRRDRAMQPTPSDHLGQPLVVTARKAERRRSSRVRRWETRPNFPAGTCGPVSALPVINGHFRQNGERDRCAGHARYASPIDVITSPAPASEYSTCLMHYLTFDVEEIDDSISTLEAMASTPAKQHAAVLAEVQRVLDWAWRRFPDSHGPVDDGMAWHHDLQIAIEGDNWYAVTLTLTGNVRFVEEFIATFGRAAD
jgi:hypothetical protein